MAMLPAVPTKIHRSDEWGFDPANLRGYNFGDQFDEGVFKSGLDLLHRRHDFVKEFSWTVPTPSIVAAIAAHARATGDRILDPMAGTGYWAKLLTDVGCNVLASDLEPHGNNWHPAEVDRFVEVTAASAETISGACPDRLLLLAWPPCRSDVATRALTAYHEAGGTHVVYIGEHEGGCCGDDDLFELLGFGDCYRDGGWSDDDDAEEVVAHLAPLFEVTEEHTPPQFYGMHDFVSMHVRREVGSPIDLERHA